MLFSKSAKNVLLVLLGILMFISIVGCSLSSSPVGASADQTQTEQIHGPATVNIGGGHTMEIPRGWVDASVGGGGIYLYENPPYPSEKGRLKGVLRVKVGDYGQIIDSLQDAEAVGESTCTTREVNGVTVEIWTAPAQPEAGYNVLIYIDGVSTVNMLAYTGGDNYKEITANYTYFGDLIDQIVNSIK